MRDHIGGAELKEMLLCAYEALESNKQSINELNVFPVPDGDTGTNMTLTVSAAAAELRGKIIEALSRRIAAEPGNIRLHRQLERCYRAKISTIHSFCVDIIRQNAHKLDITPDFKVIDEAEADILREKVLGDVLEERYSKIAENSAFANLTDMVSTGRSDKKL